MKITMKYPNIYGNDLYDGREHTIVPLELYSFNLNGLNLYLMTYDDDTYRSTFQTILRKDGDKFYKVKS